MPEHVPASTPRLVGRNSTTAIEPSPVETRIEFTRPVPLAELGEHVLLDGAAAVRVELVRWEEVAGEVTVVHEVRVLDTAPVVPREGCGCDDCRGARGRRLASDGVLLDRVRGSRRRVDRQRVRLFGGSS